MATPVHTPRTRFIRPFTTHILNPFTRLFVHRLPGFAIINHRGRKSGQTYRTPMNVFRDGDDYLFALTYGSDVQWVKNILAATPHAATRAFHARCHARKRVPTYASSQHGARQLAEDLSGDALSAMSAGPPPIVL